MKTAYSLYPHYLTLFNIFPSKQFVHKRS